MSTTPKFEQAEKYLEEKIESWKWDFNPIPNESTPSGEGPGAERAFSVRQYGLNTWGDLFNSRQKLALVNFAEMFTSLEISPANSPF